MMRVRHYSLTVAVGTAGLLCIWASPRFAQSPNWYKFGPAARYQATTVHDANSDIMVLFGGQHTDTTTNYNDVWWAHNVVSAACLPPCDLQWNGPTNFGTIPSARFGHTAIYDPVNLRMVVFAGAAGVETPSPCLNDLYVFENATGSSGKPTWIKLSPTGSPPPIRYSHNAVYDAADNLMIVFGGNNCGSTYYNDVWVLSNANGLGGTPAWSQLSPSGPGPSARSLSSAVYDPASNRLIVYGGYNGSILGDLWVLTNANGLGGSPAWLQLEPAGTAPTKRYGHSAVYDSTDNLMMVYGGTIPGGNIVGDTWVLSNANGLGGSPSWTLTVPGTGNAPAKTLQSALYDPASNKMIIFAGKIPEALSGDVDDDEINVLNDANGLGDSSAWTFTGREH